MVDGRDQVALQRGDGVVVGALRRSASAGSRRRCRGRGRARPGSRPCRSRHSAATIVGNGATSRMVWSASVAPSTSSEGSMPSSLASADTAVRRSASERGLVGHGGDAGQQPRGAVGQGAGVADATSEGGGGVRVGQRAVQQQVPDVLDACGGGPARSRRTGGSGRSPRGPRTSPMAVSATATPARPAGTVMGSGLLMRAPSVGGTGWSCGGCRRRPSSTTGGGRGARRRGTATSSRRPRTRAAGWGRRSPRGRWRRARRWTAPPGSSRAPRGGRVPSAARAGARSGAAAASLRTSTSAGSSGSPLPHAMATRAIAPRSRRGPVEVVGGDARRGVDQPGLHRPAGQVARGAQAFEPAPPALPDGGDEVEAGAAGEEVEVELGRPRCRRRGPPRCGGGRCGPWRWSWGATSGRRTCLRHQFNRLHWELQPRGTPVAHPPTTL